MTTTTTDLDADSTRIVAKLAEIQSRIAELNSDAEALKAELRALPAGDYTIDGKPALRVTATRRFDPAKGLELVPEPLREQCYTQALDAAKVKEYLAPALVETCMVTSGKPRVTVL